jgi:hypothetical protein
MIAKVGTYGGASIRLGRIVDVAGVRLVKKIRLDRMAFRTLVARQLGKAHI